MPHGLSAAATQKNLIENSVSTEDTMAASQSGALRVLAAKKRLSSTDSIMTSRSDPPHPSSRESRFSRSGTFPLDQAILSNVGIQFQERHPGLTEDFTLDGGGGSFLRRISPKEPQRTDEYVNPHVQLHPFLSSSLDSNVHQTRESSNLLAPYYSIVFVHGLSGDCTTTWTRAGFYWPRQLARDMPYARVLVFQYDVNVWMQCKVDPIRDIARDLLRLLDKSRSGQQANSTTWVSHSLGGVIVKEVGQRCDIWFFFPSIVTNGTPGLSLRRHF